MDHGDDIHRAVCQCGATSIALKGDPILSATCYCESCRTASLGFELDLGAPKTTTPDGGVDYCSYRKDRVAISGGSQHLKEFRLKAESPTRRVVATCCNSPMFADFTPGHWISIFRVRLSEHAPKPEMRLMTKDKLPDVELSKDIPTYSKMPLLLIFKLIGSWAAMGFRRPKVVW